MTGVKDSYAKYQKLIENILFPLVLLFYPLVGINQGIDVSDTTYSLANFQYFGQMDGTWIVATFLANAVGSLLMHLPFGNTLLGMNFYTSLIQSLTALTVYYVLRRRMSAVFVAVGEFMALGLCWCPSVILYNYLTYLLMTAGILLLYVGIREERESSRRWYFLAAGVCLGANVAVRMPNVVQAALILAVWYGVWITGDHAKAEGKAENGQFRIRIYRVMRSTLWCIDGYLIGFGIPFLAICIRYGLQAYPAMVQTMFAMTEKAADYKPSSMLTGMLGDYGWGLYWMLFAGICMAAGRLVFGVLDKPPRAAAGRQFPTGGQSSTGGQSFADGRSSGKGRLLRNVCRIGYAAVLLILLRFYWGRGMFHFRYYEYGNGCVYYPAVLLLLVSLFAAAYCLVGKEVCREQKVLGLLVILEAFLTPLGSNNDLYPIINNLFLAVPFLLWVVYDRSRKARLEKEAGAEGSISSSGMRDSTQFVEKGRFGFVWKAPLAILVLLVLVQSVGLHANFAFQDGIWGEGRDTRIKKPTKAAGVYTNRDNGELLEELAVYVETSGLSGREVLPYGEIPGLGYLLDMPPALSTFWPDLDSYRMVEFERDMAETAHRMEMGQEGPVIILASPVAAYLGEDADAMNWFGVNREKLDADEKLKQLGAFMKSYGYVECFGNGRYTVYESERE